jgi:hypothetical protein
MGEENFRKLAEEFQAGTTDMCVAAENAGIVLPEVLGKASSDAAELVTNNSTALVVDTAKILTTGATSAAKGWASGFGDLGAIAQVATSAANVAGAATGEFMAVVRNSYSWGWDATSGMAEGVKAAAHLLVGAARNVAGEIAAHWHFSRPDKGPLREYEQWMPDMVKGLAASLKGATPVLIDQVNNMAKDVQTTLAKDYRIDAPSVELTTNKGASRFSDSGNWQDAFATPAKGQGAQPSYTINNLEYTPDSRVARLIEDLFAEVMQLRTMKVMV